MVIVASGITAIIAVTLASVFSNTFKNLSYATAKSDYNDFMADVSRVVLDSRYCKAAFHNGTISQPKQARFMAGVDDASMLLQQIQGQKIIIANEGDKIGPYLVVDSIKLEYQKDNNGNTVAPAVDSPTLGQTTHHVNLIVNVKQKAETGPEMFSNNRNPLKLTIVTRTSTGEIIDCQDSVNSNGIQWVRTFANPTFPLKVDFPIGTTKILVMITASHSYQLPSDMGRTVGSRYSYSSTSSGTGQFAQMEVGAGNNNGAQARMMSSTSGVIAVTNMEHTVTLTRNGFLLGPSGQTMCTGNCGMSYSTPSVIVLGM